MVGDPFAAVGEVDDAAAVEAVFGEGALHGQVVLMSVDPQLRADGQGVVEAAAGDATAALGYGDVVDHGVGAFVEPLAVEDLPVGGVDALTEIEDGGDLAILGADIEVAVVDVFGQEAALRVAVAPLVRVAGPAHGVSGVGIDLLDDGKLRKPGRTEIK